MLNENAMLGWQYTDSARLRPLHYATKNTARFKDIGVLISVDLPRVTTWMVLVSNRGIHVW